MVFIAHKVPKGLIVQEHAIIDSSGEVLSDEFHVYDAKKRDNV